MKKYLRNTTRAFMRRACILLLLALSPIALADALQDAKQAGIVGEQRDGFLGAVAGNPSQEIQALIERVNQERKARYEEIAKKNNLSLQQVQALAFEQAQQATQAGNYVQDSRGAWVKK